MYDDDKIAVSQQQGQYNNKGITNNEPRTDPAFVIMVMVITAEWVVPAPNN